MLIGVVNHLLYYSKSQKGMLATGLASLLSFIPAKTLESQETIDRWRSQMMENEENHAVPSLKKQYEIIHSALDNSNESCIEWSNYHYSLNVSLTNTPRFLPVHGFFFGSRGTKETGKRYYSIAMGLLRPLARGSVHIASANPLDLPSVDPNYFGHPLDAEIFTSGLKLALKVFNTEPLKEEILEPVEPTEEQIAQGDEGLAAYHRNVLMPVFHLVGSASMLPRSEGGVVDNKLKVYGLSNLRVVSYLSSPYTIFVGSRVLIRSTVLSCR
jgi:hypothetical protein